jgi:hypothetical protein
MDKSEGYWGVKDWLVKQEDSLKRRDEYAFLLPLENLGNFQHDVMATLATILDRVEELVFKIQMLSDQHYQDQHSDRAAES